MITLPSADKLRATLLGSFDLDELPRSIRCSLLLPPATENTTKYRNDPKFSDRSVWANSADPDLTAPTGAVSSGSSLFAIQFIFF